MDGSRSRHLSAKMGLLSCTPSRGAIGATALVRYAKQKPSTVDPRFVALLARKPARVASVAIANKMARIAWAVMVRGGVFERGHAPMLADKLG